MRRSLGDGDNVYRQTARTCALLCDTMSMTDTDYFKSLPPWRSVSVTGVAETAPSDTVDETIRLNHYKWGLSVTSDTHPYVGAHLPKSKNTNRLSESF